MKPAVIILLSLCLAAAPAAALTIPSSPSSETPTPAFSGGAPSLQPIDNQKDIVFVKFLATAAGGILLLDANQSNDWYGGFLVGMVAISFLFDG